MQDSTASSLVQDIWERYSYNPLTGKLYSRSRFKYVDGYSTIDTRNYRRLTANVSLNGKQMQMAYGKIVYIWIHGVVPDANYHVDHINHDSHDNRPCNLRCITVRQNNQNRRGRPSPGVYWNKNRNKWQAQIRHGTQRKYLGLFTTEAAALLRYIEECDLYGYAVLQSVRERAAYLKAEVT